MVVKALRAGGEVVNIYHGTKAGASAMTFSDDLGCRGETRGIAAACTCGTYLVIDIRFVIEFKLMSCSGFLWCLMRCVVVGKICQVAGQDVASSEIILEIAQQQIFHEYICGNQYTSPEIFKYKRPGHFPLIALERSTPTRLDTAYLDPNNDK